MIKRNFDEMISYFNRTVADMDIDQKYKIMLLGIVTAIGQEHEWTKPRWIPVTERLPEMDDRVLVYTTGHEYHVWDAMPNRGENYAWEDEEGLYHNLYEADLWLPLPESYREDGD